MSYAVQVLPEATEETAAIYAYYEEARVWASVFCKP